MLVTRLLIRDQREPVVCERVARLRGQGAPEIPFRIAHLAEGDRTTSRIDQRDFRGAIERIFHCDVELRQCLALALVLAQIPAPIVMEVGIVGRKLKRTFEVLLCLAIFTEHRIDEAVKVVRRRIIRVERHRKIELLDRHVHLSALVIARSKVGMQAGAVLRAGRRLRRDRDSWRRLRH